MRYPASEKLEIIQLVEQSHLPVRRTLAQLGIAPSTFYRWYDLYQSGGPEAAQVQAKNSIEKMLAHQLANAHKLAMSFAGQAREQAQEVSDDIFGDRSLHVDHASKMARSSARMMDAFQKGVLALHKLRTGGTQVVTVQHVNVSDGGQAVVTGGIGGGDEN